MATKSKSKRGVNHKRGGTTRSVTVTEELRQQLFSIALDGAREAALRPAPPLKEAVSDLIAGISRMLREHDANLSVDQVVEGVMNALEPSILGASFVAPASKTVRRHVEQALSRGGQEPSSTPDGKLVRSAEDSSQKPASEPQRRVPEPAGERVGAAHPKGRVQPIADPFNYDLDVPF